MFWRELIYLLPRNEEDYQIKKNKKIKNETSLHSTKQRLPKEKYITTPSLDFNVYENDDTCSEGQESGNSDYFEKLSKESSLFVLLPNELMVLIFNHLPTRDLCLTIPCICKHWKTIVDDPHLWKELYVSRWGTIPKKVKRELLKKARKISNASQLKNDKWLANTYETFYPSSPIPAKKEKSTKSSSGWHLQEIISSDDYCTSGDESCDESSDFFVDSREEFSFDENKIIEQENVSQTIETDLLGAKKNKEHKKICVLELHKPNLKDFENECSELDFRQDSPRLAERSASYERESDSLDSLSSDADEETMFNPNFASCPSLPRAHRSLANYIPAAKHASVPSYSGIGSSWKDLYLKRTLMERNWREVRCAASTLKGHSLAVMCVKAAGKTILSCSLDNTIKIWDADQRKCLSTFTGHRDWVTYVDFQHSLYGSPNKKRIVSCSYDATIKLWNTDNKQCVSNFRGHQNIVWAVVMTDNKIVSCSSDATLKIWDVETGNCLTTLAGHKGCVYSAAADMKRGVVVSGSTDKTIKMWDLNSGECVSTLNGHTDRLCCLQYDGDQQLIVSGSRDSTIRVWDVSKNETGENSGKESCVGVISGHVGRVCSLQFDEEKILSGSDDMTVKLWDMEQVRSGVAKHTGGAGRKNVQNGLLLNTFAHDSWVNSLWFDDSRLITGTAGDTIKVLDFASGCGTRSSNERCIVS